MTDVLERLESLMESQNRRCSNHGCLYRRRGGIGTNSICQCGTMRPQAADGLRLRSFAFKLKNLAEDMADEITRLRASPWVTVQKLVPGEGAVEVDDPHYPAAGVDVLVEVTSALGTEYVVHRISTYPRNWSWPSFGLRWAPIPPLDPTPEQV